MTDARVAFHELRSQAGVAYDHRAALGTLDDVEERVSRHRIRRAVLGTVVSGFVLAGAAFFAIQQPWERDTAPVQQPTPAPTPTETIAANNGTPAWCHNAAIVPGKPAQNLGGLEGWWNSTPDGPCDEWDQEIQDHPDVVQINTADGTMMEADYRTDISALGAYAELGGDFKVPNPDPSWPKDSVVIIDARTSEVLVVSPLSDYPDLTKSDSTG